MATTTSLAEPIPVEVTLRAAGVMGLLGIALVHFIDVFDTIRETPYLGALFLALIIACLALAARLAQRPTRATWAAAGGLALLVVVGYTLSRTTGLPADRGDIGNWTEPLGLAALFVEGLVVLLSVYAATTLLDRAGS